MGTDAPAEFYRVDKNILLNGMLQFDISCNKDEVFEYVCDIITSFTGYQCLPQDVEFIKCSGKMCGVSQTAPGFSWCGAAIKHLSGQG